MNRIMMVLALGLACAPGAALAQDSDAPADTTPPPTADCTTLDCNSTRQQQDNLNNNSGTPAAPDSLGEDRGATGGSGTLPPTTPDDSPNSSLGGRDNDGGLGGGGSEGLSGSGSLNGGSSGGGLSD